MRDTIAAIATATGGGVGMVRLSGPQALAVAGRVFRPMNPAKSPETMPGYTFPQTSFYPISSQKG